jgi:hypothetical protein
MTSEIFATHVRYTGITLGYQVGAALVGGTAPLLATYLLSEFGESWLPVAAYIIVISLVSVGAVAVSGWVTAKEARLTAARGAGRVAVDAPGAA